MEDQLNVDGGYMQNVVNWSTIRHTGMAKLIPEHPAFKNYSTCWAFSALVAKIVVAKGKKGCNLRTLRGNFHILFFK